MNRRKFLGMLAGVATLPVLAPLEALVPKKEVFYNTYIQGNDAVISCTIGEYAEYISYSDLALVDCIDPVMVDLANEMNYRLAITLNQLVMAS